MKKKILLILILLLVASLIPFRTTLVPEWKVQVVNETGVPYKNQLVRQFCQNYTLGVDSCNTDNATQRTDTDGYVVFPERTITMPFLLRFFKGILNTVLLLFHGSIGTSIYLDSSGPYGYKELRFIPGESPPEKLILPSKSSKTEM